MGKIEEIVVISGKGGTGKTTLTASLVSYWAKENMVIADCDVDAPDLDILFHKKIDHVEDFIGLQKAYVDVEKCIKCGKCAEKCKFDAITEDIEFLEHKCEGCGLCEFICPVGAVEMKDAVVGKLYISSTEYGDMVHARLIPGEETSGKLVSEVRKTAKKIAQNTGKKYILVDGSPGVACNVISSITGASQVIIVTEPTLSGLHDLKRVYELSQKFRLKVSVVVNKHDISLEQTAKIEKFCKDNKIETILKIPFNRKIVENISIKKLPLIGEEYLEELNSLIEEKN
jgi:MinD superfamily P-loop ATPase